MGVSENENAKVQTLFHARCLHSSFEFSQTFMNVSLLDENKERNHEINFGNIFLLHSVFILVFSKNICDSVKLPSVIFDSEQLQ